MRKETLFGMSRERLFGAILMVLVLVGMGLALELFVRLFIDTGKQYDLEMWKYARDLKRVAADPRIGHEHRPDTYAHLMGVEVKTNRQKLRDRDIAFERTPGTIRILMLGDSLTFGWGVPIEKTFVKRLEALINDTGVKAETINAGVGNYNTSMEVAYYLSEGYRYHPDIVVLNYFINDAEQMPRYDASWFRPVSAAHVYFGSRVDIALRRLGSRAPWRSYLSDLYDPSKPASGWRDVENSFARFAEFSRGRGSTGIVVNLPELRELQPYPFEKESAQVRTLAVQNGLLYLEALSAVEGFQPRSLWVSDEDPHPNAVAHQRFADAMFEFMRSNQLLRIGRGQ